jgi:hypothetical protein
MHGESQMQASAEALGHALLFCRAAVAILLIDCLLAFLIPFRRTYILHHSCLCLLCVCLVCVLAQLIGTGMMIVVALVMVCVLLRVHLSSTSLGVFLRVHVSFYVSMCLAMCVSF